MQAWPWLDFDLQCLNYEDRKNIYAAIHGTKVCFWHSLFKISHEQKEGVIKKMKIWLPGLFVPTQEISKAKV